MFQLWLNSFVRSCRSIQCLPNEIDYQNRNIASDQLSLMIRKPSQNVDVSRLNYRHANIITPNRWDRLLSVLDMHSWSDYVLHLVNSTATIVAIMAAALALMSIAVMYFTGTELTERAKQKNPVSGLDRRESLRLAQTETELAAARRLEAAQSSHLTKTEAELAEVRRSEAAKSSRLAQVEAELAAARRSAEETNALVKQLEHKQGPRTITSEQRSQFLNAVRGLPTGKVIVSAFFDNKETREFAAQILSLLNAAGFNIIERAPLNFFTTSRPSSGVRIGCEDMNNPPPHFDTVREGLRAIGVDAPTTGLVNAQQDDVVEIQITPK